MALTSKKDSSSLWTPVVSGRPETAENPGEVPASTGASDPSSGRLQKTRKAEVRRVSVYPWEGQNRKLCFRLSLELDPNLDPSNRFRRTETVLGLELEIEEKELTALARLSGREIDIHYLLPAKQVQTEALEAEIQRLQIENQALRHKLDKVEDQLQFVVDSHRVR